MSPALLRVVKRAAKAVDPAVTVTNVAYHRNGVAGEGFHVITFAYNEGGMIRRMVGVLFGAGDEQPREEIRTAVMDTDLLAEGKIDAVDDNTWRGDHFDPALVAAVAAYNDRWIEMELPHIRARARGTE